MGAKSRLEPPDVPQLAETARISLTPQQVEEFAPKIRKVVDWFGQLQAADLQSVEPAIRADTDGDNLRDDMPEIFYNRDAITAVVQRVIVERSQSPEQGVIVEPFSIDLSFLVAYM